MDDAEQNPLDVNMEPDQDGGRQASTAEVVVNEITGTIFIQGRGLKKSLSDPTKLFFFTLGDDLLDESKRSVVPYSIWYEMFGTELLSLKVMEYVGPVSDPQTAHLSSDVLVKVAVYFLHADSEVRKSDEDDDLLQARVTPLPNVQFDGRWDQLAFETNIKEELIWIMENIFRFSRHGNEELSDRDDDNPVFLLHGPPGTGKTTLCQGFAQEISIRFNQKYHEALLIEVNTATLLSKYFSESAKQVDEVFTKVEQMCGENPDRFICLLIDEVESIAASRELGSKRGEVQDAIRATNALLTSLDRIRFHTNLVILCTSNMWDTLDSAFLNRCGFQYRVEIPSNAAKYAILRVRLQKLMRLGVITPYADLPCYRNSECEYFGTEKPGAILLNIVKLIDTNNMSGREITQLPKQAIYRYLRARDCSLDMALGFMQRLLLERRQLSIGHKRKREDEDSMSENDAASCEGA
ncbi:hypothetical protein BP6252_05097 [Coleophoma cylindrospora]|uniref:AAA+ ATPase domain-containing protein n=1 Tax=Coleophoma cylindrospora TaxID=1849047 RepID=A0A3D8RT48_9HELO|nr:hypothetical protein BP6252_05097 [Coleophoma cylindrospora]